MAVNIERPVIIHMFLIPSSFFIVTIVAIQGTWIQELFRNSKVIKNKDDDNSYLSAILRNG
jgi:hypothetical protein